MDSSSDLMGMLEAHVAMDHARESLGAAASNPAEASPGPLARDSNGGPVGVGVPSPGLWAKRGLHTSPVSVLMIPALNISVDTDTSVGDDDEDEARPGPRVVFTPKFKYKKTAWHLL